MRLLEVVDNGKLGFTEFTRDFIPDYAILSHTWGADEDEISYKDMQQGSAAYKSGYRKLEFCRDQVKKDDLRYFWIDTCCIDRSSSAELGEAINSMFRWYQNAIKCYVYLTDVSAVGTEDDKTSQLRKSRWFTRGWTLQELIAPKYVEFFSEEQSLLGDKKKLEPLLTDITGISVYALRGDPLFQFSIDERTSWMKKRSTKRGEDMAYSLLGIFDINMPAIYGEGERSAMRRLREEINK